MGRRAKLLSMLRKPRPKGVPPLEKVVAQNLESLMAHHRQTSTVAAAKATGVSQQQIDRILKGQKVRVDTLENLARGYGLEPYQMLIPGLNPGNPQVLRAVSAAEESLYEAFREAVAAERKRGTN